MCDSQGQARCAWRLTAVLCNLYRKSDLKLIVKSSEAKREVKELL